MLLSSVDVYLGMLSMNTFVGGSPRLHPMVQMALPTTRREYFATAASASMIVKKLTYACVPDVVFVFFVSITTLKMVCCVASSKLLLTLSAVVPFARSLTNRDGG